MEKLKETLERELQKFTELPDSKKNTAQYRVERSTLSLNGENSVERFVVEFRTKQKAR